ncbi:MAG: SAM-dependent methyltransferase [Micromonosporaceae bacterium]|nr:SAM-dependent methyltransferase [Micromonosporaceae bacterium]
MSPKAFNLSPELHEYVLAHSTPVDEVARDLIAETHSNLPKQSGMQIAPEQAAFLTLMTRTIGVRHAVEVGTFTGYSSLAIARGLADGGTLVCCDVSQEWTAIAQRYWKRAGVDHRIQLKLAPAIETLRALPREACLDMAFIDADKEGYVGYWEELVPRMRQGGVIFVDNVLWSGRVTDASVDDANTVAIRAFNDHAAADDRVELVVLPIADGLTMARRK